jgi:N-acyl-L-homoserine lactone synthetase
MPAVSVLYFPFSETTPDMKEEPPGRRARINGKGLGSRLMLSIMDFAREKGLSEIEGLVMANNPNMLKLMRGLGFVVKSFPEDPDFKLITHHLQSV